MKFIQLTIPSGGVTYVAVDSIIELRSVPIEDKEWRTKSNSPLASSSTYIYFSPFNQHEDYLLVEERVTSILSRLEATLC